MPRGRVIKNYNGYYYVDPGSGGAVECRRRGKMKEKILVGDMVEFTATGAQKGVIEKTEPRKNSLRRPAVANIDAMFIVMAAAAPDPSRFLIDQMLMTCEYDGIHPSLCFNKCDLDKPLAEEYAAFYRRCGYAAYPVSACTGEGIDSLKALLDGKVTAFAGPSGVGKSSLLMRIIGRELAVGKVSDKIGRGRHTTRHSEIMKLREQTYVIDTPGFSALDFTHLKEKEITSLMPDLAKYSGHCRFSSCLHRSEPDCSVKQALAEGKILRERYDTYCKIEDSIAERK